MKKPDAVVLRWFESNPTHNMKKQMYRQAIETTPSELRKIADYLEKDMIETMKNIQTPLDTKDAGNTRYIVPIINRSECSDTWKFEKLK